MGMFKRPLLFFLLLLSVAAAALDKKKHHVPPTMAPTNSTETPAPSIHNTTTIAPSAAPNSTIAPNNATNAPTLTPTTGSHHNTTTPYPTVAPIHTPTAAPTKAPMTTIIITTVITGRSGVFSPKQLLGAYSFSWYFLGFGAFMSNRYRIYYFLRGVWYTILGMDCTQRIWRKLTGRGTVDSGLNTIIFEDNPDMSEGLLLRETD